jgi:hypothetical protein
MTLNLDIDIGFVLCYKLAPPRQKDIACPKDVVRRVAGGV